MMPPNVLIPCKALSESKSRLSQLLPAAARYDLCVRLLERTIKLAKTIAPARRIFLVSIDATAIIRAREHGVSVIAHPGDLNDALTAARTLIGRVCDSDEALIVLPIDLVRADEAALRNAMRTSQVTIIPDGDRSGTNLLALSGDAAGEFPFRFGPGSFARHRDAAQKANYSLSVVDDPILAFDLDSPEDYLHAERSGYLRTLEFAS
jgi:2-phospho-L-lactate guanylyltransferase